MRADCTFKDEEYNQKLEYRGFDPRTSRKPVKEYDCRASDLPIDLIPHHHNSGIFITLYTLNNLKTAIRCALDRLIPSFLQQIQQQSNALGKKNVRKKSVIPIGTQTGGKPEAVADQRSAVAHLAHAAQRWRAREQPERQQRDETEAAIAAAAAADALQRKRPVPQRPREGLAHSRRTLPRQRRGVHRPRPPQPTGRNTTQ